jgi:hypothetical protein
LRDAQPFAVSYQPWDWFPHRSNAYSAETLLAVWRTVPASKKEPNP